MPNSTTYFERFSPRRLWAWSLRVQSHVVKTSLKQQQDTVHDPHDEVWGLPQLPHCGNVSSLDGLQGRLGLLQCWACCLQLAFCNGFVSLKDHRNSSYYTGTCRKYCTHRRFFTFPFHMCHYTSPQYHQPELGPYLSLSAQMLLPSLQPVPSR